MQTNRHSQNSQKRTRGMYGTGDHLKSLHWRVVPLLRKHGVKRPRMMTGVKTSGIRRTGDKADLVKQSLRKRKEKKEGKDCRRKRISGPQVVKGLWNLELLKCSENLKLVMRCEVMCFCSSGCIERKRKAIKVEEVNLKRCVCQVGHGGGLPWWRRLGTSLKILHSFC